MRLFDIDVAECNLKPSMKRFKCLGFSKLLLVNAISYFTTNTAIYNGYELRMTHERKSATWSVSCSARGDCLHFAFLVKIFCKHGAFHSIWESEICFVLCIIKRNEAKIFWTNCWKGEHFNYSTCFIFEAIYILKCWTHFWFCGLKRIACQKRDAGTLVQESSFFSKTAFSHKVWPIHLKSMNIFDIQEYYLAQIFLRLKHEMLPRKWYLAACECYAWRP